MHAMLVSDKEPTTEWSMNPLSMKRLVNRSQRRAETRHKLA
jgi:hypothetical protein